MVQVSSVRIFRGPCGDLLGAAVDPTRQYNTAQVTVQYKLQYSIVYDCIVL